METKTRAVSYCPRPTLIRKPSPWSAPTNSPTTAPITERVAPMRSPPRNTGSADVGLLAVKGPFRFGASVKNITEPDLGYIEVDRIPSELRSGFAYNGDIAFFENATVSVEYVQRDDDRDLHLGWENAFFKDHAFFRSGYNSRELTLGLGYKFVFSALWNIGLDYAYIIPLQLAEQNAVTQRMSIVIQFGGM